MNDATLNEIFGPATANTKPVLARRRFSLTERNARFLDDMELNGCDSSSLVNMALNTFIPKTYNNNFNLNEIIRHAK